MHKITKNTLLNYIPNGFITEKSIKSERIYEVSNILNTNKLIIYLCEREIRAKDNFALSFSILKAKESNLPLKIIHPKIYYRYKPKADFIDSQILQVKKIYKELNLDFEIVSAGNIENFIKKLNPAILIIDFNPILKRNWLKNINCKIYEIDGHNIVPARYVSDKQEYNASTLRRKIYYNITQFLNEYENLTNEKTEADYILENFINNKLPYYAEFKNNPSKSITSGLSKYLNLGFISSQRVAIEVINSNVSTENKETFLEELIIRKELADNFCLYSKNFKKFLSIPNWAKISLNNHKQDLRFYIYSINELENAKTHDTLWNASQIQLIKYGKIHGYLRMYWAKKILEWTSSPNEALKIAIYLNDKYAFDSPSSNGYTGILWSIGGLHDRAFIDYPITGKIRRMTFNSIKKKYDLKEYIKKYSANY